MSTNSSIRFMLLLFYYLLLVASSIPVFPCEKLTFVIKQIYLSNDEIPLHKFP